MEWSTKIDPMLVSHPGCADIPATVTAGGKPHFVQRASDGTVDGISEAWTLIQATEIHQQKGLSQTESKSPSLLIP